MEQTILFCIWELFAIVYDVKYMLVKQNGSYQIE